MMPLKSGPDAVQLNKPSRQRERSRSLYPCKLPANSALKLLIQNGATVQSAIFVHSYGYIISVPLVLHWVYGQ